MVLVDEDETVELQHSLIHTFVSNLTNPTENRIRSPDPLENPYACI